MFQVASFSRYDLLPVIVILFAKIYCISNKAYYYTEE